MKANKSLISNNQIVSELLVWCLDTNFPIIHHSYSLYLLGENVFLAEFYEETSKNYSNLTPKMTVICKGPQLMKNFVGLGLCLRLDSGQYNTILHGININMYCLL